MEYKREIEVRGKFEKQRMWKYYKHESMQAWAT